MQTQPATLEAYTQLEFDELPIAPKKQLADAGTGISTERLIIPKTKQEDQEV